MALYPSNINVLLTGQVVHRDLAISPEILCPILQGVALYSYAIYLAQLLSGRPGKSEKTEKLMVLCHLTEFPQIQFWPWL